jgi:hypothetical protein
VIRSLLVAAALAAAGAPSSPAPAGGGGRGEGAPAPAKLRIGLDRLRAAGVEKAWAEAVEQRVCAALAEAARGAEVVCPADIEAAARLAKDAMVFGGCQPDDCLKQVEAVRAADDRVSGAVERKDGAVLLTLRRSGPNGRTAEASGRLPEDLDGVAARVPEIVKKLVP